MAQKPKRSLTEYEIGKERRNLLLKSAVTFFALCILAIYLMPMAYGVITSLKTKAQTSDPGAPILPAEAVSFEYEGDSYDVLQVPTESGISEWALVTKGRSASQFIDPANPEAGLIEWEGNWRQLEPCENSRFNGTTTRKPGTPSALRGCLPIRWVMR